MEVWKTIPRFPDYSVSDHGRIRRDTPSRHGGSRSKPGLILRQQSHQTGHRTVMLYRKTRLVHRLVLEAHVGHAPEGMECCHNDGDPANNRLENLRWDTHEENMRDRVTHGTSNRGEGNHWAKLTEADVRLIKTAFRWFGPKLSGTALARHFGVRQSTISIIKCGKSWAWVTI